MCPLSVWARDLGVIPESVEAIAGRVLHEVRQRVARTAPAPTPSEISTIMGSVLEACEERLRRDPATAALVPLAQVFGRRKWVDAAARLHRWAGDRSPHRAAPPSRQSASGSIPIADAVLPLGDERSWHVPALRLSGRPDHAALASDGAVEIVDFKSGNIFDREDVRSSVVTQLHLYALMAQHVTGRPVRLFVHGRRRVSIEWNDTARGMVSERLTTFSTKYPAGRLLSASEVSHPGSQCVGCRLRAQCSGYLSGVSVWWPNTGTNPRPLPLDAWGTVLSCDRDAAGWTLRLSDPIGRTVVISGIDDRHGVKDVQKGEEIFAFGLGAGEDEFMHGRALQPRSFHEHSPSPRWRSSPCAQFHRGRIVEAIKS